MIPYTTYTILLFPQIQVAHFEPDAITLVGEGYYPRISLSLPRPIVQNTSPELEEIKTSLVGGKRSKKKKVGVKYM